MLTHKGLSPPRPPKLCKCGRPCQRFVVRRISQDNRFVEEIRGYSREPSFGKTVQEVCEKRAASSGGGCCSNPCVTVMESPVDLCEHSVIEILRDGLRTLFFPRRR
jgi:hypothetical protein